MFITLLISTCAAFLAIGVLLILFRLFGRTPPGWLIPATIGLSIIGAVTYMRYTWADTIIDRLPESVRVIETFRESAFYEPWTYLLPRITHFVAIDEATLAVHPQLKGVYLVEMVLVAEGNPTMSVPQVIDCIQGRRSSLRPDASLDPADLPETLDWQFGRTPPYLFEAVCGR